MKITIPLTGTANTESKQVSDWDWIRFSYLGPQIAARV